MTKNQIDSVLEAVRAWPQQDQEELAEAAREIEARRKGVYATTAEECAAIAAAQEGAFASDDDVKAFWKARDIA